VNGRNWLLIGTIVAGLGIGLGALGAHWFENLAKKKLYINEPTLEERRIENWHTAVEYQMYHGLAILVIGVAAMMSPQRTWDVAGGLMLAGTVLFSGSLYWIGLYGPGKLNVGLIIATPAGGVIFLVGWAVMAIAATRAVRK
jgi:uncharacterized membrane protein YgdD (TMEM256/DUF423 family)